MSVLAAVLTLALLAAVIVVVSGPLRRSREGAGEPGSKAPARAAEQEAERAELEAAREAKYREIRDTELDFRTGKLSREDYEAVNAGLRSEAVAILNRLESLAQEATADPSK
ncbi:MAG TPA: hypothetical protein VK672_06480 [Solirubrobacteraceae bacterium]|jgi:hypothetical protein|nr:hypothetical protein [Solirubrobacteraceae bacterium]